MNNEMPRLADGIEEMLKMAGLTLRWHGDEQLFNITGHGFSTAMRANMPYEDWVAAAQRHIGGRVNHHRNQSIGF